MARIVRVHLGYCGVGVVVLWSVELCFGVLEFVYFYGSSVGVEMIDVKGSQLLHEGCCVCVLGGTLHISLMSFFCSVASGLIYPLLLFAVPHTVMLLIRWG